MAFKIENTARNVCFKFPPLEVSPIEPITGQNTWECPLKNRIQKKFVMIDSRQLEKKGEERGIRLDGI